MVHRVFSKSDFYYKCSLYVYLTAQQISKKRSYRQRSRTFGPTTVTRQSNKVCLIAQEMLILPQYESLYELLPQNYYIFPYYTWKEILQFLSTFLDRICHNKPICFGSFSKPFYTVTISYQQSSLCLQLEEQKVQFFLLLKSLRCEQKVRHPFDHPLKQLSKLGVLLTHL